MPGFTENSSIKKQYQLEIALWLKEEQPEIAACLYLAAQGRLQPADLNTLFNGSPESQEHRKRLGCPYLTRWMVDTGQDPMKVLKDCQKAIGLESTYKHVIRYLSQHQRKGEAEIAELIAEGKLKLHPYHLSDSEMKKLEHSAQQLLVDIGDISEILEPRMRVAVSNRSAGPKRS